MRFLIFLLLIYAVKSSKINENYEKIGVPSFPEANETVFESYMEIGLTYEQVVALGFSPEEPIIAIGNWTGDHSKLTTSRIRRRSLGLIIDECLCSNPFSSMEDLEFMNIKLSDFFGVNLKIRCLDKLIWDLIACFFLLVPFTCLCSHFYHSFDLDTIITILKSLAIIFSLFLFLVASDFFFSDLVDKNLLTEDQILGYISLYIYFVLLTAFSLILLNLGLFQYTSCHAVFLMILVWLGGSGRASYSLVIPVIVVYGFRSFHTYLRIIAGIGWFKIALRSSSYISQTFSFFKEILDEEMMKFELSPKNISEPIEKTTEMWFNNLSQMDLICFFLVIIMFLTAYNIGFGKIPYDSFIEFFFRFKIFVASLARLSRSHIEELESALFILNAETGKKNSKKKSNSSSSFKSNSGGNLNEISKYILSFWRSRKDNNFDSLKERFSCFFFDLEWPEDFRDWNQAEQKEDRRSWREIYNGPLRHGLSEEDVEILGNRILDDLRMDRIVDFVMNETFSSETVDSLFLEIRDFSFDREPPDFELDHDVKPSTSKESHTSTSSKRRIMEEEEIFCSLNDLDDTQLDASTDNEVKSENSYFSLESENSQLRNRRDLRPDGSQTTLIERHNSDHDYGSSECHCCCLLT